MYLKSVILLLCVGAIACKDCPSVKRINSKLICYYSTGNKVDNCYCTHVVLPVGTNVKEIENLRTRLIGVKILLTVNEFNQGLVDTVKQNNIDGLELNLKNLKSKEDITDFISTVRTKLGNNLYLALSIPPRTELLAKYYDLKALTKTTDLFILQTAFLGASKNVTFHPSRLSGMWDMQNTDSVVDLVTGLGAPLSRLAVTAPVQAFQFRLQDSGLTTPGSPALELKTITRKELCQRMNDGKEKWTLERDQDQAGPYIFRGTEWIAFEDPTSIDIKAKYTRVRGLAGLALKDLSQDLVSSEDDTDSCSSLLSAAHAGLSRQNRAPRGAVLRSLEREILETPSFAHPLEKVNVSPYRITRVVDVEGHVHSVRKDTRTEFTCTRQGYFVHPQSCGRFYRCVKFDQLTDEFSVFEFDCPAGLAFDERVEVCVWPGSLPHGAPCQGSSEIAPVPRGRFKCPSQPGYYADPENCRWFFACMDHGQSEMTAYEFRCPFGLVFDEKHLLCEWPWLVPTCGQGYITGLELDSIQFYGGAAQSTVITGGHNINVQAHSGAQILDTYDGLGVLGGVALGGYQGDINALKNSLHAQELEVANVNVHQGNEFGHLYGFGNEGNAQNIHLIHQDTSNLNHGVGSASSFSHFESANDKSEGLNFGALSGQENIGVLNTNIKSEFGSGLNVGHSFGNQDKVGVIHFGTANLNSGINSELNLGLLNAGKQESVVLQNYGQKYHGNSGYESGQEGITLIDSGIKTQGVNKIATSSVEFNNYNKGQETVLLNGGANLEQTVTYQNAPVQHSVLLDSQKASLNYNGDHLTLLNNANNAHAINTGKTASSYQTIQHSISDKVSTVPIHSGTLNYEYQYANEGKYIQQPIVSFGTKLTHIGEYKKPESQVSVTNYASKYIGVTPKTEVFNLKSTYDYQTPVVHYEQKIQPVVLKSDGAKSNSYSSIHHYQTPIVQYEQKVEQPVVQYEQKVQPIVYKTNEGAKSHSYSTVNHYQTPVQYEQKIEQPVLIQQNIELKTPVVQQELYLQKDNKEQSHSNSYSTINQYHTPSVQYEQKVEQPVLVQQDVVLKQAKEQSNANSYSTVNHYHTPAVQYEHKIEQPVLVQQEVLLHKQDKGQLNANSYSTVNQYHTPTVQYEQKIEQPVLVQQEVLLHKQDKGQLNANSYSTVNQYHTPTVQYEQKIEQPVLVQQTPVVQQEIVLHKEAKTQSNANSYSSVNHYHTPSVQYEQKIEQPVLVQQTPVVQQELLLHKQDKGQLNANSYSTVNQYHTPTVQYEQKIEQPVLVQQTPVVQQEIVLQKQAKVQSNANSYSTINQYHTPTVQYEQKIEQPVLVQQTPVVQQEIVLHKEAKTQSNANSYSSVNHYHTPTVQYEQKIEQPVLVQQTPVVQQEIVLQKQAKVQSNANSYSTLNHYHTPSVQYEQKIEQPVEQEIVLQKQAKVQSNANSYSTINHYHIPTVQYEQKVEQPVLVQQDQIVQQEVLLHKQANEQSHSNSYSTVNHYHTPVVQYEQKVEQVPIVQQQVLLNKQVKEHSNANSYSTVNHYNTPVQYEQKIEQPVLIQQTKEQSNANSYSTVNHYHTPAVQYEQKIEQPVVQQVLLQKEIKTPVVPIVEAKQQSASYSSINHYHTPTVQYEQKIEQPIVQQSIELKAPVQETKQSYSSSFHFQHNTGSQTQDIQLPVVTPKYEKVEEIKYSAPEIKQTSYSTSFLKHEVPTVQYEQKVQQPIVHYEERIQPNVYNSESSKSYSQINHYESPVVQYEQKIPIVQEKVLLHKVETPVTQKYETNYQEINLPVIKEPVGFVQTVTATPKYESHSYSTFKHHISAPKVETVSVQPITYEAKVPVVEPKFVQKFVQPLYYNKQVDHIQTVTVAPKVVNTYLPVKPIVTKQESREYLPPKPIVNTVYVSTPKPQPVEVYVSTTPKYSVFQEFVQPKQTFEIKKTVQPVTYQSYNLETSVKNVTPAPTIVESYSYLPPKVEIKQNREYLPPVQSTPKTYLPPKQVYVSTTPKYDVFQEIFQQKQTYDTKKTVSPTVISEYQYENPEFAHYESKLNFNSAQDLSYEYQPTKLPKVQTETVYYSTQKPIQTIPIKSYQTDYILSTPKPTFVSTIAPVIKQTPTIRTKVVAINKYETDDNKYLVSSPKSIYISTPAPEISQTEATLGEFKYYDSRFDTGVKKAEFEETNQYLKDTSEVFNQFGNYEYAEVPQSQVVTSTVRPIQRKKIVSTTTQLPYEYQEYYDDKFDSQYIVSTTTYKPQARKNYVSTTTQQYYDNIGYVTSTPKYVTTIRPVQRKKIVSTTTALPIYEENYNNEYVITTSRPRIVTTTARPIIKKKKIVTTTTALPEEYDEYIVSSVKPAVKITPRPKGKTIVRVNDFHPFLTTKLGAQCTCVSNTLKLRKSKEQEEIQEYDLPDNVPVTKITSSGPSSYDDYNEPGVYVVGNSDSLDYDYEPKKFVAVTKSPEVIIKSTTNAVQPAPTPVYTIRKKVTSSVRPTVSEVVDEVFIRNSKSKEEKIAEAVNEGLSLVKSAIKGYVKDAVDEEVRNFDRYGPGGWRSRDETLQGSVDCKRAGLFRHPTQCNKFYACHWDCTKQRYTLHVFNCPVHLTFDSTQGACNWPSKGPACTDNTLLPSS